MSVITISKEFGCGSQKIATLLGRELGYEYIGKRLVSEIAKELNISESEAEGFRKRSHSRLLKVLDRYTCSVVQRVVGREYGCLDDKKYFQVTKKLVEDLYKAGNVIILGWGGQCILKGKPDTFHVRLVEDRNLRVKTVADRLQVGIARAEEIVAREEHDSKEYIKYYFNADWNDPTLYDLIVDTGKISVPEAVKMISGGLKKKVS